MRNWFPKALLPALVMSVALWACDFQGDSGSPLAPEAASFNTSSTGLKIAEQSVSEIGSVSAVIGTEGGTLRVGKHELVVPAGAVDQPTTFRVEKSVADKVRFKLTATVNTTNDVGSSGFKTPVTIRASYENVTNLPADLSRLKVIWLKPDGTYEVQSTTLDSSNKRVSASLSHFSEYGVGEP